MGKCIGFLFLLAFVVNVKAETVQVYCASTASSTTLLLNPLSFPDRQDDCDIGYNDDCGRIIGRYTLTADLSDLHSPIAGSDGRQRVIDTFDEANDSDLEISDTAEFTIQFEAGFRGQLHTTQGAMVTITSHVVTEEPPSVKLYCHIQ